MSRWTPNKPMEQVMQVREPFSRKGGHRVGNGKAAGKSLTQAVKEAEGSAAKCNEALVEMRGLARCVRDAQADIRARVRRAVWTVAACAAATVGSFLYALARLGAL